MRRVTLPGLGGIKDDAVSAALKEIMLASAEVDLTDIAAAFTVSGTYTPTRTLNVTSPSTANIAAVLATLIDDFKRGGTKRTT